MLNFALRFSALVLVLVLLTPPILGWYRFVLLALALLWLFTGTPRRNGRVWVWAGLITLGVVGVMLLAPRPAIQEGHNLFVTLAEDPAGSKVDEPLRQGLPQPVWERMAARFLAHYPPQSQCTPGFGNCWRNSGVPSAVFSYSSDAIFQRGVKYSRVVNGLDFSSLESFRGGFVNTMGVYPGELYMNWYGEASAIKRERMPWFMMLELNDAMAGSRLCWVGEVMWENGKGGYDLLNQPSRQCREIASKDAGKKLFGLAIEPAGRLEMAFVPSGQLVFWGLVTELVRLLGWLAVLGLLAVPAPALFGRYLGLWGGVAGYLALTGQMGRWFHYQVFMGGDDGLTYEGLGRAMLRWLLEGNWVAFLRGGEDVYYFMPGFRYFRLLEKLLFGDSMAGVLLLLLVLSGVFYRLLRVVFPPAPDGRRRLAGAALLLFFLTLENFVRNATFGNPELLGYGAFILATVLVLEALWGWVGRPHKEEAYVHGMLLGGGFTMFVAAFTRPNLLPGIAVVLGGAAWWLIGQKRLSHLVWMSVGFAPLALIPFHNWFFSHRLVWLTAAAEIPENLLVPPVLYGQALLALAHADFSTPAVALVGAHLYEWMGFGGGRLLFFVPHLLFLIRPPRQAGWPIRLLAWAGMAQHGVLFFYHPSGRYAVLAWLISFLVTLAWLDARVAEGFRQWWAQRWDGLAALPARGLALVLGFALTDTRGAIDYLSRKVDGLASGGKVGEAGLKGVDRMKVVYRPWLAPFHELLPLVKPNGRLLDIGCGNGVFLALVAQYRQPAALAGIEIAAGPLEIAHRLVSPPPGGKLALRLEPYDGKTLPLWVGEYSQISLIDVLHHIPPQAQKPFLEALHQAMRPGAELLLKDIDAGRWLLVWINRIHDRVLAGEMGRELSAAACREMLQQAGFDCSQVHSRRMLLYPHFTIVAKKRD